MPSNRAGSWKTRWLQRIEVLGGREALAGATLYQQLLVTRNLIASVMRSQGAYSEAYELDLGVLAEQERLFGKQHPHTLQSYPV